MWSLIVHGGAKAISPDKAAANREGVSRALEAGASLLAGGGSSVDAVETALRILESDPAFNAGYGSELNEDGEVEMCAAVMDGERLDVGAVAAIKGVRHPVSVSRSMLRQNPILIVGDGARVFADQNQAELCDPNDLISSKKMDKSSSRGHDTVGCLALDESGNLAVATSTGGLSQVPAGRVGDSPLPGAGFYADNDIGAVAFSGDGEVIARLMLAARVMENLSKSGPQGAVETEISRIMANGGEAGGIALSRNSEFGWAHNSSHFVVGLADSGRPHRVYLSKAEEVADDGT